MSRRIWMEAQKGRMKMFGPNLQRHLIAAFAAVLMSTVAVGAAIVPATSFASEGVIVRA
ncbi:MAG: hypothetical protein ABIU10_01515 [Sphingomicrobium sp.]